MGFDGVVALVGSQPHPTEDRSISQTLIASPAKPGDLLLFISTRVGSSENMWPENVKIAMLTKTGRHCALCRRFKGTKIELHHIEPEAKGGESTEANCIPLCFDCHADVGNYNSAHPKGTKLSKRELKLHRDKWIETWSRYTGYEENFPKGESPILLYDDQHCTLDGFLWREGIVNEGDGPLQWYLEGKMWWVLNLPNPVTLRSIHPENDSPVDLKIEKVQLGFNGIAELHLPLISGPARATGRICPAESGWHVFDAVLHLSPITQQGNLSSGAGCQSHGGLP